MPLVVGLGCSTVFAAKDLPVFEFQGTNYAGWKTTGTAFRSGPVTSGDLLTRLEIENAGGSSVASSEVEGDGPQGTLTSPEFKIVRPFIGFRIAGGDYERDTCLNLLIDGRVVLSATGWRSDHLTPISWDVRQFLGRKVRIQFVDTASGDWGHLNVARIVQTDTPEQLPEPVAALYSEALRPQFHFTARQWTMNRLNPGQRQEGWINDLNGLIYYEGEYHLFAQRWAKCWLHAVSKDLVHWTELEPAFWEESNGSGVQSGTCVVDYENTSGLSPDKRNPPLIAFWSRFDNRSHCLTYSLDRGRTWKHYAKNPVLVFPERDPKVFWHAASRRWVMMMYGDNQYHMFTSPNLLDWTDEKNPIPNSFECPDFFELPIDGDPARKTWVLIRGDGKYSLGRFDGRKFTEDTTQQVCDLGPNFYATQSWHNTDTGDGRRIQVAWMRAPGFPDMPFNQQISFPCELTLHATPQGPRLFRQPIREITLLHQSTDLWTNRTLRAGQTLPLAPSGRQFHLKAEVEIPEGSSLVFRVRGVPVVLKAKTLESGTKPAAVQDRVRSVELLIDRASIEAFVNGGELSSTRFILPPESGLSVRAEGGPATIRSLTLHPLKSAWPDKAVK